MFRYSHYLNWNLTLYNDIIEKLVEAPVKKPNFSLNGTHRFGPLPNQKRVNIFNVHGEQISMFL